MSDFPICHFLVNAATELKTHEKLSFKNDKVLLKKYELAYHSCMDATDYKRVGEITTTSRKLKREKDLLEVRVSRGTEANASLLEECEVLSSQLSEKQNELLLLAQQQEQIKEEASKVNTDLKESKKKFERIYKSILYTKDVYKKNLECHVRLQKSDKEGKVFIFSFATYGQLSKSDSMPMKSAKLHENPENYWRLLDTNPPISHFNELVQKFEKSQDTQGLLAYLKSIFELNKSV